MKTHFYKNKFAYTCLSFTIVLVSMFVILFNVNSKAIRANSIGVSSSKVEESTAANYNTSNDDKEVPHFNLFNIINKFIPN